MQDIRYNQLKEQETLRFVTSVSNINSNLSNVKLHRAPSIKTSQLSIQETTDTEQEKFTFSDREQVLLESENDLLFHQLEAEMKQVK